ncbi:MAG TPA: elongation factor P maturation arginine rhamnosyltransferase EarP [Cellvibrio sp.]|nr:elongation factor P maturation arginine rhamnosyltransferase EarP [Cellvibrio sp.]
MNQQTKTWDIFCRVIDNYGDIGVCWRLARQLANEHQQQIRLWVDDLNSLIRIWPTANICDQQWLEGVEVCYWPESFPENPRIAQVVIEAFGCDIPATYLQSITTEKRKGKAPFWFNLEYLSAERWVEECHGMTSVHPSTGLRKHFFFPGFTVKTGGLLREKNLLINRDNFDKCLFLKQIGIQHHEGLLISLFAYENPAVASLLQDWANSPEPIHCLVPQGKIMTSISQQPGFDLQINKPVIKGNLQLEAIPFLTQAEYDQLLWACDINFVRGEDSFVRAQWAGKPFIWHIYPQEEQAHIVKLDAFLDSFLADSLKADERFLHSNIRAFWHSWNENQTLEGNWPQLQKLLPEWQQVTQDWCTRLASQTDLASQLLNLIAKPDQ